MALQGMVKKVGGTKGGFGGMGAGLGGGMMGLGGPSSGGSEMLGVK
jgi:hypothetical protein